jgi:hypothetical protein
VDPAFNVFARCMRMVMHTCVLAGGAACPSQLLVRHPQALLISAPVERIYVACLCLMFYHIVIDDTVQAEGVLAVEERGLVLVMSALRVAYAGGGDGETALRTDIRDMAGFVRDPGAAVTAALLPLSAGCKYDGKVGASESTLQRPPCAAAVQRWLVAAAADGVCSCGTLDAAAPAVQLARLGLVVHGDGESAASSFSCLSSWAKPR